MIIALPAVKGVEGLNSDSEEIMRRFFVIAVLGAPVAPATAHAQAVELTLNCQIETAWDWIKDQHSKSSGSSNRAHAA
jgi:hypothetical protein